MDKQNRVVDRSVWEEKASQKHENAQTMDIAGDTAPLSKTRLRLSKKLLRNVPATVRKHVSARVLIPSLVLIILMVLGSAAAWWFFYATNSVVAYRVGGLQSVQRDAGGGGVIYPRQQLDISYPLSEHVLDVMVRPGDQVKPKQALIKLDVAQINAQIQESAKDVQAARNYLYSIGNVASPVIVAQAQQQYQVAQNRYSSIMSQNANFRNGTLVSPMKGVVTAVNINAGEMSAPNSVLLTIVDQTTVVVRAQVPLDYMGVVHSGSAAYVIPSAMPGASFEGVVSAIIPQADPQTDTFEVRISVSNVRQAIVSGMGAFVRIQFQSSALIIPSGAVYDATSGSTVYVLRDGRISARTVHVVGRSTDSVFVDSGLVPGERIALSARNDLHDDQEASITRIVE